MEDGTLIYVKLSAGRDEIVLWVAPVSCRNKIYKAFARFRGGRNAAPYTQAFSNEVDLVSARLRRGIFRDGDN